MSEEQRSNGAKSDGATKQQMDRTKEPQRDGKMDRRSDGAMERRSDGSNKQRSNRKTKRISDRGTERRSHSNKTKISRLLNCWRKIRDSRDLKQGFSHAPTVGILEEYQ